MRRWLARWDVTPAEQAGMTFGQVLTRVNVRRVEIVALLGLFTRVSEMATGYRGPSLWFEIGMMLTVLFGSMALRNTNTAWLGRGFVACVLVIALLDTQYAVAALGEKGRLTSGYPLMLLSLTMLFVVPPRIVALGCAGLLICYCTVVVDIPVTNHEKVIAIVNAGIVSVIAVVAAALIYSGRRRDHEQKREIRIQNDRLRDRNEELDTLMAITAHDMRSPLYGLRNLFDLAIRRSAQENDLPLIVLRQAMPSIDAMLGLATRLLDAHAAEHGPMTRLVDEDVRGHVLAAIERIGPLAQSSDIRVDVELPDRPLIARFDVGGLAQILDNLLGNGVRFSPQGSILTLGASGVAGVGGGQVRIVVSDQGPGIDEAVQATLFSKFHRGISGQSDSLPGTGMGLFIVATLAERMNAHVWHDPVRDGGTAFTVLLPVNQNPAGEFVG
jgi:signal transduction histidine kinase